MNPTELTARLKKLYNNQYYLEAFLLQSTYIEELVRNCANYNFFSAVHTVYYDEPVLKEIERKLNEENFAYLIDFIAKAKFINDEDKESLHIYRKKRNKVIHGMIDQISHKNYEKGIKEVYDLGNKLIKEGTFWEVKEIVDFQMEQINNKS